MLELPSLYEFFITVNFFFLKLVTCLSRRSQSPVLSSYRLKSFVANRYCSVFVHKTTAIKTILILLFNSVFYFKACWIILCILNIFPDPSLLRGGWKTERESRKQRSFYSNLHGKLSKSPLSPKIIREKIAVFAYCFLFVSDRKVISSCW